MSTFRYRIRIIAGTSGCERGNPESSASDDYHTQGGPYDCEIRTGVITPDGQRQRKSQHRDYGEHHQGENQQPGCRAAA